MRNHETTDALLRIVGPDRGRHPLRVVDGAERELRLRTGDENRRFLLKLSRFGGVAAGLGVMAFLSAFGFLLVFPAIAPLSDENAAGVASLPFAWLEILFVALPCLQSISGILLFSGGIGLRSRSHWAPATTAIPIAYGMCATLVGTVAISYFVAALTSSGPTGLGAIFLLLAIANAALWMFLLWMALRFVLSPRVRHECGLEGASATARPRT